MTRIRAAASPRGAKQAQGDRRGRLPMSPGKPGPRWLFQAGAPGAAPPLAHLVPAASLSLTWQPTRVVQRNLPMESAPARPS